MKKILLDSYLVKNLGDDLFVHKIVNQYQGVSFSAVAGRKYKGWSKKRNLHLRYDLLNRACYRLFGKRLYEIGKYDARVVLGGSMFIERNKTKKELEDDLNKKYLHGKKPLFVIGANFGPYRHKYFYEGYRDVFSKAVDVCFREKYSVGLFNGLGNVRFAPDVIFGLDVSEYKVKEEKKIIVSVMDLQNRKGLSKHKEEYERKISEIIDYYSKRGYEVIMMSFCKAEGDEKAIRSIMKRTNNRASVFYYDGNIEEALNTISSSELIIGTRFHSIILGFIFNKRVFPIIYSSKTINMLKDVGFGGGSVEIDDIGMLDIGKIDEMSAKLENISKIARESARQFSALNKFLDSAGK